MLRVVMHWTGGAGVASAHDKQHYHGLTEANGRWVDGVPVEYNEAPLHEDYAAHTRALNTDSIGLAMCGMHDAQENPFDAGRYPLTKVQETEFVKMMAHYAKKYEIPVTRETVLTHAEVQPTLGVWQNGKWDITWLPGMNHAGDPVAVGDIIRMRVRAFMKPDRKPRWPRLSRWLRWRS